MKKVLLNLLLAVVATVAVAQVPNKIWFDQTDLRTGAIKHFAHGRYLDCIMNCQKLYAMGEADGLVSGLLAMSYDSLQHNEASSKELRVTRQYKVDSALLIRLAAANLTPEIYKRNVLHTAAGHYNKSRYDSSEVFFEEFLKLAPNDTFAIFFLANAQFYQGKHAQALVSYKRLLDLDFNRADVHNLTGLCYMIQNNYLQARDYFSQALILDKSLGNAHFNLGKVYYGLNDRQSAIKSLNEAYAYAPKDSGIIAMLSELYSDMQDLKNAEKFLAKLYALNRNNERIGWKLVNIAFQNKDYEHAAAYLQNLIRVNPRNVQAYNKLGEAYFALNSYEQAFNNYEIALQKVGDNRDFFYGAGYSANRIGLYGKAIEHLTKAVSLDMSHAASYKELGDSYMGMKKKKLAKKNFKMAENLGYKKEQPAQPEKSNMQAKI